MPRVYRFAVLLQLHYTAVADFRKPQAIFHEASMSQDVVTTSSNRAFGAVFAALFALIGLWPCFFGEPLRPWALLAAAGFVAAAVAFPALLGPLNRIWLGFGSLMHLGASPVVLAALFFLLFTPIGWLMRITGVRSLKIGFDPEAKSYWIEKPRAGPSRESMRDQF